MSNLATIVNNILADSGIDDINVVVTTGSYSNPAWITSLAWTKITGAPANIVTGTGTTNTLPKFTGASTIGNSNITDSGSLIQLLSNTQLQGKLYYTYDWLQEKNFGYSSGWKTLAIGSLTSANNFSLAFGVDVSGNPSGAFTGNGNEYFWRNTGSFKTPNAANNGYNQLFEWNSSGGMTFNQAAEFIGTVTVGSPLSIKSTTPYIQWINASSTRLAYIQHNATNLVYNADTGTHIFNQSVTVTDNLYVKSSAYPNIYYTSLRSNSSAVGILQLGNNNDNYIIGGNNNTGGYLIFRVNATTESITSGVEALRLNANATASFSSRVNVNGASDDADIALQTVAPSGAGKYIYVGRDSSAQWRFSVSSSGDTQIGVPQAGAVYKLLTLSSNGNDLDNGTVLRLIGNSALDLVDISVRDTTTRIFHQENAADAANGYGKIQFRTSAVANPSFPTRGGFQFTVNTTDALFINSLGQATFSNNVTATTLTLNATVADYAATITNVQDSSQGLLVRATDNDSSLYLLNLQSSNTTTGQTWVDRFTVAKNGAATFSAGVSAASFSTGGDIYFTTVSSGLYVYATKPAIRYSYFGYSSGYNGVLVGGTGSQTLFFNVDVTSNPSGAFSGNGSEYVWRNAGSFITPNAINNGYNTLFGWNSSGQITFNQTSFFSGNLIALGSLQIGNYTQPTNTLTFAAANNGINKINFYDQNTTEGLYLRTDGEQYGGTMTFGARWDDDEAKIVFKMYQVSAGGPYNARVGIGTGALSPLSMLHVCELDGGNYTGTFRVGGASGFGIVSEYTQSAFTTGTMYVSPSYSSADVLFKLGAGLGNTNQLVLRGNGNVGINVASPTSLLTLRPPTVTTDSTIEFTNSDNAAITSYYSMTFAVDNTNAVGGRRIVFAKGAKGYGNQVRTIMELLGDNGNVLIGTTTDAGRLTAKYSTYSSGQTPLYIGNTGFTNWNRQAYDTFVLQQDDVTSFRMVEKNGETTASDQVLTFSIGDGVGVIATSAQPLDFFVNGSPSGVAYQGLSGTRALRLNTNGSAQFYGSLNADSTISTSGNFVATNSGIAEIRLRGGGYGTSYNTSLRSIVGAPGVLQFGNNGINYILAGNTLGGGFLEFRVNCASESIAAGSLALTLNSNATATFASSVTATSFFESSDRRLKSNILDLDINVSSIIAKTYLKNGVEEIGYLAQDVESILPSAISKRDDGYLDLSYRQVHTAKIAYLEKRITELEQQLKNK
jgi:hypothetical protein